MLPGPFQQEDTCRGSPPRDLVQNRQKRPRVMDLLVDGHREPWAGLGGAGHGEARPLCSLCQASSSICGKSPEPHPSPLRFLWVLFPGPTSWARGRIELFCGVRPQGPFQGVLMSWNIPGTWGIF